MTRYKVTLLCLGSLLAGVLLSGKQSILVQGQENSTPSATVEASVISKANKIFLLRGKDIRIWDPSTLRETSYATLSSDSGTEVGYSELSSDGRFVYFIEGAFPHDLTPMFNVQTRLMQLDPQTQQKKVIYEGIDFLKFKLSPDGQHAAIVYSEHGAGSHVLLCILEVKTGSCGKFDKPLDFSAKVFWVDNQVVIAFVGGFEPYRINADTLQQQRLTGLEKWYPQIGISIPKTHIILLAAENRDSKTFGPPNFVTYDLDTAKLTVLPYGPINNTYIQLFDLQFSPDGRYFTYTNYQNTGLVDFRESKFIVDLKGIRNVQWQPDSSAFFVTVPLDGGLTNISQFDPQTGQVKQSVKVEGDVSAVIAR